VIFDLTPQTEPGRRLYEAALGLVPEFRERADAADREARMCAENFTALQRTGITAAFVPEELGGFGLDSIHDWLLGISTLAQGDASTAIGINMHLGVTRGMAIAYQDALAKERPTEGAATPLKAVAAGKMLICATATERGTDNLHPQTLATAVDEGWRIDGSKMFVTMSPIATHLAMNLRMHDTDGDHIASTMLPINTPGVVPQDDWDALGMRSSGSQSIVFDNVVVSKQAVRRIGPWGRWSTSSLINRTLGNLTLVAAFHGIAEHAYELALVSLAKQKRLGKPVIGSPGVQHSVGEMEIKMAQCRSILRQTGLGVDEWLANAAIEPPTIESAHGLMKDYQLAKWVVNRGAIDIVSNAMDLAGGAGFMNSNALPRLYRDVRAGPFMQPHAATDIRGYVGQVVLGLYPES
jgi:alkylation response protein AidB-like acyl-CoA dehydrogenase